MANKKTTQKRRKRNRMKRMLAMAAVALGVVLVGLVGIFGFIRLGSPVALKARDYTISVGTEFEPLDNVRYVFLGSSEDVQLSGYEQVDTDQPGQFDLAYTYNGKSYPFTLRVEDAQSPVLEVHDYSTDLVDEPDALAFISLVEDDSPYSLSIQTDSTPGTSGSQSVTITATDIYGNSTSKTATITRSQDTEAPVLEGFEENVEIKMGNPLKEDYAASDNLDASPAVSIVSDTVDIHTPGSYQRTYVVTDRSGNESTYTQNVDVIETKIAYFTFDDGPSQNTRRILDILDQYGVKATFFVTAQNPEYFQYMKDAAEAGHTIAIHTLTHDFSSVYSSADAYFADLEAMKDIIREWTGVEADCIRFPGGSSNTISASYSSGIMSYLVDAVHQAGYEYFDWNVDSQDASGNNVAVETIYAGATAGIGEPEAVILFHDTDAKDTTVEALPAIIEAYLAAGYEFQGLTVDSFGAHHGVNN